MGRARLAADDRLLEVVAIDGWSAWSSAPPPGAGARPPGPPRPPRRRRRTPWIVAAALTLAPAVVLPVRVHVSVSELTRVEQRWLSARSVVAQHDSIVIRLHTQATTDDAALVDRTEAALDDEAARALIAIHHDLSSMVVVDGGVRRARQAVASWIESETIDRVEHLSETPKSTEHAFDAAAAAVARQQERWRRTASAPSAAPSLHTADAALATMDHYVDTPTGARLVATDGLGFSVVDVDASRTDAARPTGVELGTPTSAPVVLVPRSGYLGFVTGRTAWSMASDATGPARFLGTAGDVVPSVRADAVWLVDAPFRGALTAREVDGQGATLDGPYTLTSRPVAAVRGGLLVNSNSGEGLAVIDPATSRVVRTITDSGVLVAVSVDQVAWLASDTPTSRLQLHLTSLAGGPEEVVDSPIGAKAFGPGTFSPDGRMMAAAFFDGTTRPGRFRLAIVDVGLRRTQAIGGVVGDGAPQSIAWSPDGTRVFVSSDADHSLATWRLGETRISQLRLAGIRARQVVVFPSAT